VVEDWRRSTRWPLADAGGRREERPVEVAENTEENKKKKNIKTKTGVCPGHWGFFFAWGFSAVCRFPTVRGAFEVLRRLWMVSSFRGFARYSVGVACLYFVDGSRWSECKKS